MYKSFVLCLIRSEIESNELHMHLFFSLWNVSQRIDEARFKQHKES